MTLLRSIIGRNPLAAWVAALLVVGSLAVLAPAALAQEGAKHGGGEANLTLPDLHTVSFVGGLDGHTLLLFGIGVCVLGLLFGILTYGQLRGLPVHKSMLEISELIYETCKTYLLQQGKFLAVLWIFISAIVLVYFGWLAVTGVDAAGNQLSEVHLTGVNGYDFTAEMLAWGGMRVAAMGLAAKGALGPVDAFGLERLRLAAEQAGIAVAHS